MRQIPTPRVSKEHEHHMHFFNISAPEIFQIMNIEWVSEAVKFALKLTGLEKRSYQNALNLQVTEHSITLQNLPESFEGYKILFITDLHIDGIDELPAIIIDRINDLEYDICLLGGDYRFQLHGKAFKTIELMKDLVEKLVLKSRVAAVLGNHDQYAIGTAMNNAGADVLINENITIVKGCEQISICGVDDCHYYVAHDFDQALEGTRTDSFKIFLSHSPEIYKDAEKYGFDLYLAGHTHAGQICLPRRTAILAEANIPRKLIYGPWQHRNMKGYTSCGAGSSGAPARFNCPPEVALITLRCGK